MMQGGAPPESFRAEDEKIDALKTKQILTKEYAINSGDKTPIKIVNGGGVSHETPKPQTMLLTLPPGERPDSRSSMGRFIFDIMKHDATTLQKKKQTGRNAAKRLSKSIDVSS